MCTTFKMDCCSAFTIPIIVILQGDNTQAHSIRCLNCNIYAPEEYKLLIKKHCLLR